MTDIKGDIRTYFLDRHGCNLYKLNVLHAVLFLLSDRFWAKDEEYRQNFFEKIVVDVKNVMLAGRTDEVDTEGLELGDETPIGCIGLLVQLEEEERLNLLKIRGLTGSERTLSTLNACGISMAGCVAYSDPFIRDELDDVREGHLPDWRRDDYIGTPYELPEGAYENRYDMCPDAPKATLEMKFKLPELPKQFIIYRYVHTHRGAYILIPEGANREV